MGIVICPGLVAAAAGGDFWEAVEMQRYRSDDSDGKGKGCDPETVIILPPDCPVYSPQHVLQAVLPSLLTEQNPWVWIGFSAGVVGGLGAARQSHADFPVQSFIALDAWGIPLVAPFPIYHLSHDLWTHGVVSMFNRLAGSFYADPGVTHLELWTIPGKVTGWDCNPAHSSRSTTAAAYIAQLINSRSIS